MSNPCRGFTGRLLVSGWGTVCGVPFCLASFSCSSCITGFFSSWGGGGAEKKASTPFPEDCFRLFVRSSNSSGGRLLLPIDYLLNYCLICGRAFMIGELHNNGSLKPGRLGNPHGEWDIRIKDSDTGVSCRAL